MKQSRVDKNLTRIKNNPIVALLITLAVILLAIVTFTDAVKNLIATIDQLRGPPTPVDISGKWKAKETGGTSLAYFNFKVVGDKLYGAVYSGEYNSESGIPDGEIVGNQISFTTKYEYTIAPMQYNFQTKHRTPAVRGEHTIEYKGEIIGDEIHFKTLTGDGHYSEITAKKIIDLTKITTRNPPPGNMNVYALQYILSGHDGGVQSLSFGPDQGRYYSGGLRLMSGGSKDAKIKYWDVATAEPRGTRELRPAKNVGVIHIAYDPKTLNDGVDFIAVGVSKDRKQVTFRHWHTSPSGATSGSGRSPEYNGIVESIATSKDTLVVAVNEKEAVSKSTITTRFNGGHLKNTLKCEGVVSEIALSADGNLLASAEVMPSKETILKLWNATTGIIKWQTSSQAPINHLVFNPNTSLLATAGSEEGLITIWDVSTGALKFTLSEEQNNGISSITFGNRSKILVSADSPSGVIKFWDTVTGTLDHAVNNEEPVSALSFSYDDRLLAAGSSDKGTINIWAKTDNPK